MEKLIIPRQEMESARWKQGGKKQQDKEYKTGYLEHYITYRKGKGACRRNEKV